MIEIITKSPTETIEFGKKLGERLRGGEVISLVGELGAGKTHLVKGIALGVGAKESEKVTSPTFVLVNEYHGRLEVFHIDAYRLERERDFEMLGFDDFLYPGSVVIVEWANKVAGVLGRLNCIQITIRHAGENEREIAVENEPEWLTNIVNC